ncbi:DUF4364 family protein [Caproiciproducens sp. LBM24188]|nr:DUF4364 family protein [Oscillospiraceae bacterium]HHV33036.1 DUF4364 family protein [Clostridiales bacterium]
MEFDAFTGGVEPGGLRTKNEIRILICYLLSSVNAPLSKEDILNIVQDNGFANYFEVTDALSELAEHGNIIVSGEKKELCTASDTAKLIAKQLDTALPHSVRDKAVAAAITLLAKAKREQENSVEILRDERGYQVRCHISGGNLELMSFTLHVPDKFQANMVKEQFHNSPETVYRMMLALVTGNHDVAAEILKENT